MMCAGASQGGVEVRGYDSAIPASPRETGRSAMATCGATSTPATACRRQLPPAECEWISTRMLLSAFRTSCVVTESGYPGEASPDLEPIDRDGLHRKTKRFATGSQHHLGECCCGHDGLAVNLVILQPRYELGSHVSLPHGRGQKASDMYPQQR